MVKKLEAEFVPLTRVDKVGGVKKLWVRILDRENYQIAEFDLSERPIHEVMIDMVKSLNWDLFAIISALKNIEA